MVLHEQAETLRQEQQAQQETQQAAQSLQSSGLEILASSAQPKAGALSTGQRSYSVQSSTGQAAKGAIALHYKLRAVGSLNELSSTATK